MKRVILCCSCYGMSKKAVEAFKMLFPEKIVPVVIKGRDRVYKFYEEVGNDHVKAISKLSGKFAYYLEMEGNTIVSEYNLITGKRVS